MAAFIQNDKLHSKSKSETVVWNKIKEKLVGRDIICYFRYPLYSSIGENKKEPYILLLDKELGIIIIETKQFTINNIENIQDDKWEMKDYYIKYCNPKEEAEDYLYTIKSKFDKDRFLRNKIKGKYFIALPEITKLKWEEKRYGKIADELYIIFKDDFINNEFINKIMSQPSTIETIHIKSTFKYGPYRIRSENLKNSILKRR